MGTALTFQFRLLREYDESYQTENAVVFSDTTSSGLVPLWEAICTYESLYNSDGQEAREISRTLAYGLDRLYNEPALANLLPESQDKHFAEAIRFMENVLRACTIHPPARIETS
jgi:hypothetical protein